MHLMCNSATYLRQMLSSDNTQSSRQSLHEQTQQRRPHENPQQLVFGNGSRLQVCFDVSRVQVRDRHQPAGPSERPQHSPAETRLIHVWCDDAFVVQVSVIFLVTVRPVAIVWGDVLASWSHLWKGVGVGGAPLILGVLLDIHGKLSRT